MANLHMSKECSIFAPSFKESTFFRFSQVLFCDWESFRGSLVHLWFFLGLSLVFYPRGIGKVLEAEILIKVLLSILILLAVVPTLYGTNL